MVTDMPSIGSRRICVFTATRAEYGLLQPLISELRKDDTIALQLLVSGAHLAPEFGNTVGELEADGLHVDERVDMCLGTDTPAGICASMGIGMRGFGEALQRMMPDILVVLGDRYEAFTVAAAAQVCGIPLAHIHGGETTEAAIDEAFRHSITKMSHLHFTSTEAYRRRVIQLGEAPDRVFRVGALGVENAESLPLLSRGALEEAVSFVLGDSFLLVTYHPVTLEGPDSTEGCKQLLAALERFPRHRVVFTKANADAGGMAINEAIDSFVERHPGDSVAFASMGRLNYLSAMKHCAAVVGNSSSGIIEAPSLHVPTVNIGDRQKGRVRAASVIDCERTEEAIAGAVATAVSPEFRSSLKNVSNPYEKPDTARNIADVLRSFPLDGVMRKKFFDLS